MEKNHALAKLFAKLGLLMILCGFAATPVLASTPVRFRLVHNQPIVPVMINGTGPFDFIFDTGTSSTVIDLDLATQLLLSPIGVSRGLTVTGSQTLPRYQIDTLSLGPKSVQKLTVVCAEMRGQHEINSRIRGLLGQNFLSGFDYILNYHDQRIEFEEGGEFDSTLAGTRLPVERNRGRVLITAEGPSPHKLGPKWVMDSGTPTVVVFKENSRDCGLDIELDENWAFKASTILGSQTLSIGRLRKLQIATQKFFDLPVIVSARGAGEGRPENGLLPTRLFRSIYFNNTQNFLILNPRGPTQTSKSPASVRPETNTK